MTLVLVDGVQETTSVAPGMNAFSLSGAVASYRTFADVGDGNTTYYSAYDPIAGTRERGQGTYTLSSRTLSRDTVFSNSAGTQAKIIFSNPPVVWCDLPAAKVVVADQLTSARFPTLAAAQAAKINATVTEVVLGGYYAEGDCSPAKYKRVSSQPAHAGKFQSLDGAWWQYVPDARGANACHFGAKADGASSGTRVFSGTNNAPAIQACIDFAAYFSRCKPYIPAGVYMVSDTLQLGYGVSGYTSAALEGDGMKYRGESPFSGTMILCNFSDRPGVAFQGVRSGRLKDISFMGTNFHWIETNSLMAPVPSVDDTVLSNWLDPALNANADSRYTPYCAVAIDPYSGAQPGTAYPNVTFPAWAVGTPSQYNKNKSSGVTMEDCYFGGFATMLCIQPCNADANGDFIKLTGCHGEMFARVVSAGNSQGRQFTVAECSFGTFHTGIVNTVHGSQHGQLDGTSVGTDWEQCIQIFDIGDNTLAGSFTFINSYSESIWRIGNWGATSNGADANSLLLDSSTFQFTAQNDYRGYPASNISSSAVVPITVANSTLYGFKKMFLVSTGSMATVEFRNNHTNSGTRTNPYEQIAHSFLGGSIMPGQPNSAFVNYPLAFSNHDTFGYDGGGTLLGATFYSRYSVTNRLNSCCAWIDKARPKQQNDYEKRVPQLWSTVSKASFSSISLSGSTLTATFSSRSDQTFYYQGGLPGDVIYDSSSGSVFYIRSRTGTTIIAEIQNNYKIVGGTFDTTGMSTGGGTVTLLNAFSTSSGSLTFGNSRFYLPEYYLRGDIQTGSAQIINCGRDDGFCSWIDGDSQILVGDYNYVDQLVDFYFSAPQTLVAGVNGTTKIITLSSNGNRASTRQPLGFFIRQPPANV